MSKRVEKGYTIFFFSFLKSKRQDFFSRLNSFAFLTVIDQNKQVVFRIPAWSVLVALAAFFVIRANRSR